jgi:hypothetical protein
MYRDCTGTPVQGDLFDLETRMPKEDFSVASGKYVAVGTLSTEVQDAITEQLQVPFLNRDEVLLEIAELKSTLEYLRGILPDHRHDYDYSQEIGNDIRSAEARLASLQKLI